MEQKIQMLGRLEIVDPKAALVNVDSGTAAEEAIQHVKLGRFIGQHFLLGVRTLGSGFNK